MCRYVPDGQLTLQPEGLSVALARRFFQDHTCPKQEPAQAGIATLLVSELVTNAIRHGAPPITLKIACDDRDHVLSVRVSDASADLPIPGHPDLQDDHGRGLVITDILSNEWGVEKGDAGKPVWFRLLAIGSPNPDPPLPEDDTTGHPSP